MLAGLVFVILFMSCSMVADVSALNIVNVALHKPTLQKDTLGKAVSGLAVDGNHDNNFDHGSCSHTMSDEKNWWAVDLMTSYPVHSVEITNRVGDYHLQDFFVYVSENNPVATAPLHELDFMPGKLCFSYQDPFYSETPKRVPCEEEVTGRYLYIWEPGATHKVCLCELEVLVDDVHVNPKRKESFLSVSQGSKSLMKPFGSIFLKHQTPLVKCVLFCLSAEGGVATLIQMSKDTGRCECIEKSNFNDDSNTPVISADN